MFMASQKQIDLVNKIEYAIDIKYDGLYDVGTISEFIAKNISKYKDVVANSYYETREDLYELIDE